MSGIAVDIGRALTKGKTSDHRVMFPSILGSEADAGVAGILEASVELNGTATTVERDGEAWAREVGEDALLLSDATWAPRHRVRTPEDQLMLLSHAIRKLGKFGELDLVVGTPAQFYDRQVTELQELFTGTWTINGVMVTVRRVVVLPQPVGTAWAIALNEEGQVRVDGRAVLRDQVAVLDVGEYTTDGIVLNKMRYQPNRTFTLEVGVGQIKEAIARHLTANGYPKKAYEVDTYLRERGIRLDGEWQSLTDQIKDAVAMHVRTILGEAGAHWPDREEFSRVAITGGGAYYFGPVIRQRWPNAVVVDQPEWANCRGFWALLQWTRSQG